MAVKKREGKKLARYEQEEINARLGKATSKRMNINEFITMKELPFKLTTKQKELIKLIPQNRIITVTGPPGTSKTFLALYAAIQAYMSGKCEKIILSKPTEILSGTNEIGFLPGSLDAKLQVYIESFLDSFEDILLEKDFKHLWDEKIIEFKPAQFLRGRTLKNAYIIIDEFQNFDIKALKSIITRLGRNSNIIFMGDTKQNDINKKYVAVDTFIDIMTGLPDFLSFKFLREDIVREKLLIDIVDRFDAWEEKNLTPQTIKGT
jgi:phosphate starvation-inducible PhoH-like protein